MSGAQDRDQNRTCYSSSIILTIRLWVMHFQNAFNITLIFGIFLLTMFVTIHISHVEFILEVTSCRCRVHTLWRCLKTDIAARGLLKQDVIVFSRQFNIRDTGKHPGTERSSLADVMVHVWTDCLQSKPKQDTTCIILLVKSHIKPPNLMQTYLIV